MDTLEGLAMKTISMMGGEIETTDDGEMSVAEERATRDRIAPLWRAFIEREGRQEARDMLSAALGSNSPGQLRPQDLDHAERLLKLALKPTPQKSEGPAPLEGRAPEGFVAGIMAKVNNPARRNPINGEIVQPEPNGDEPDPAEIEAEKAAIEASLPRGAKRMAGIDTAEIWRRFNQPPKRK
jgi:hypothetical protein